MEGGDLLDGDGKLRVSAAPVARQHLIADSDALAAGLDTFGPCILRVHGVAEVTDFLRVRAVLRGEREMP